MNSEQLDWAALARLREGFLSGDAARGPYWQTPADLANYDQTYAERIGWKWDALLRELSLRHWRPPAATTVVDWGCGSGIAGRRVLAAFGPAQFASLQVWDHSPLARQFALNRAREAFPSLAVSEFADAGQPIGLLVLSHVLNELSADQRAELLALVARSQAVLWIEPGTHADSRALATIRDEVRATHNLVAPCTHREDCPLFQAAHERDWCHFFAPAPAGIQNDPDWVRFSHRAGLDLRSQAYSCLVLDHATPAQTLHPDLPAGELRNVRGLGRTEVFKPYARFLGCDVTGLHELELSKRIAPAFIKRLAKNPPPPLYALAHDGRHISAISALVADESAPVDPETQPSDVVE